MKILKFSLFLLFSIASFALKATNYYINTVIGNDANKSTTNTQPYKTIEPINSLKLLPGDSVLFASGQQFYGMLSLINVKGLAKQPIVISSYQYNNNLAKPVLDAGKKLNAILIQNCSFVTVKGIEITALTPYQNTDASKKSLLRCGILVEVTKGEEFQNIILSSLTVHDVYYNAPGFVRQASEVQTANGTQNYGWGIRFINNTKSGILANIQVLQSEIFNVSHTGLKFTATPGGIKQIIVAYCNIHETGGPGMQASGVTDGHIYRNKINHSGSTKDSRNWGRGSGFWTWSCSNILIEYNRFENANGPGDSAGIHIDYNCNNVVVQYNVSANNAGGFCEILGNNYNCAYRYNISVNDGYRVKGINGAFQEGKIFWLSGYQGDKQPKSGPFNSYFYNNSIYVAANLIPKVAITTSANGVLVANNIFYFESDAQLVAGDQKKKEAEVEDAKNIFFKNNLFLKASNWPKDVSIQDAAPVIGNPAFTNKGGLEIADYTPTNKKLIQNKGINIQPISNDKIGLMGGLQVDKDILGSTIEGLPDLGAIEIKDTKK